MTSPQALLQAIRPAVAQAEKIVELGRVLEQAVGSGQLVQDLERRREALVEATQVLQAEVAALRATATTLTAEQAASREAFAAEMAEARRLAEAALRTRTAEIAAEVTRTEVDAAARVEMALHAAQVAEQQAADAEARLAKAEARLAEVAKLATAAVS